LFCKPAWEATSSATPGSSRAPNRVPTRDVSFDTLQSTERLNSLTVRAIRSFAACFFRSTMTGSPGGWCIPGRGPASDLRHQRLVRRLLHHFLTFLDDVHDRVASLVARRLVDLFEHLLKPVDVLLGLGLMFFEGGGLGTGRPSPSWDERSGVFSKMSLRVSWNSSCRFLSMVTQIVCSRKFSNR
jgi:hypothetical protein